MCKDNANNKNNNHGNSDDNNNKTQKCKQNHSHSSNDKSISHDNDEKKMDQQKNCQTQNQQPQSHDNTNNDIDSVETSIQMIKQKHKNANIVQNPKQRQSRAIKTIIAVITFTIIVKRGLSLRYCLSAVIMTDHYLILTYNPHSASILSERTGTHLDLSLYCATIDSFTR